MTYCGRCAHKEVCGCENVFDEATTYCANRLLLEDCISRQEFKEKLTEHYNFLVNAYGGFSNMPYPEKVRADEIQMCIAEAFNLPTIQDKANMGRWIEKWGDLYCSECGFRNDDEYYLGRGVACPNCGSLMIELKNKK